MSRCSRIIRYAGLMLSVAVLLGVGLGCGRDVRLAGRKLRTVVVKAVNHYGVTLDERASAEQVAYVLLRAIRDDVRAVTPAEREAALDVQFDLAAANEIQARNRSSMARDEWVYNVVYRWVPTVSHYVGDFETEWDNARVRFVRRGPEPAKDPPSPNAECEVAMTVADPNGDPNAQVVIVVWLAQDKGFWRVLHLGFDPKRRSVGS